MKSTADYIQHVKKYYSDNSSKYHSCYDGEGDYPANAFRLEIARHLIKQISPRPLRVLDVGCGDARVLAELVKDGFDCVGFDNNELMLELGAKVLEEYDIDAGRIQNASIYEIPFPDSSFDVVLCLGVVSNLPNHDDIFSEFKRVLKPGGRVIASFTNQLFDIFTFNQYTIDLCVDLMKESNVPAEIVGDISQKLGGLVKLNEVPTPFKAMFDTDINKSGVEIEKYSQLNIEEKLRGRGFKLEEIRHYHYHPIQPRFERQYLDLFMNHAQSLETVNYDWKGALLCSALVAQFQAV
ncbi:MAG: methyltransferase domain-containing protein [Candidatus Protistobacter heckmanni]|nr:methyltransferase domain-containing protein [Candidatus Protistobacter heckmanni]